MGFFSKLFSGTPHTFKPDFSKSDYDNWLDFLDKGGTSKEWEILKKENRWAFPPDEAELHLKYEKELRPVFNTYHSLCERIEKQWSVLYNSKDYHSKLAIEIEQECFEALSYYKKIRKIDEKYGEDPLGTKLYKRLAILYERQNEYEKAIDMCKQAFSFGMDERKRMNKLIKKSGRIPTEEERDLLNITEV